MSKKGFYEILKYIDSRGPLHYNDILRHAQGTKVVDSRGQVNIIVNGLTSLGLLDRAVSLDKPVRTSYSISKKGKLVLEFLMRLEKEA
ncbi:putative transcriptional regulator [Candidatus Nitrososphaera evergladensis SR1]|uniref:Putative transcriptional regulator n=2 Tax=Nitrososphaera TaxID=497726 RepID=A0A075MQ13_9ARCH|nr:putative transcriptional regulator [Candidatus Nitrososphaera evergladensis SR1]